MAKRKKGSTLNIEIPESINDDDINGCLQDLAFKDENLGKLVREWNGRSYAFEFSYDMNIGDLTNAFAMASNYNRVKNGLEFEFHDIVYIANQREKVNIPEGGGNKELFFTSVKILLSNFAHVVALHKVKESLPKGILKSRKIPRKNKSRVTGEIKISYGTSYFLMHMGKRKGVKRASLEKMKIQISFRDKIEGILSGLDDCIKSIILGIKLSYSLEINFRKDFWNHVTKASEENKKQHEIMLGRFSREGRRGDIRTVDGTGVASKNEVVLGDILSLYSWPYYSEAPAYEYKGGRREFVSTVDFMYPCAVPLRRGVNKFGSSAVQDNIYVEIFGKMDKDDYAESARMKISNYTSVGIVPGYNFIAFVCRDPGSINAQRIYEVVTLSLLGFIPKDIVVV